MTDTYDGIVTRMKQKFTELSGYTPDDASDIGIRLKVLAGEIFSVSNAVEWLKQQTFAQTAAGQELDCRALERGITRKPAVAAAGTLTLGRKTAIWYPVTIPAGTVCASIGRGAAKYVTTQDATLPAGDLTVDVPAKAQAAGSSGNTGAQTVTILVTPPASIETVTNKTAFIGGEDAETDDSLRARLMENCLAPANGSNAEWYRQTALSCDGVNSVSVVARANGAGTVAVYLGGNGAAAADSVVAQVQNLLSTKKEINVDVTVQAAQTVPVDVTCSVRAISGLSIATVRFTCRIAIQNYFKSLSVGDSVIVSAMTSQLFGTGMVADCTFTSAGKAVAANQLAVIGALSVTVGA